MRQNDGGPAFPQCSYNMKGGYDITGGMTLRDYFAAKAISGRAPNKMSRKDMENMAARAYDLADAMLAERAK